jgi:competence protein ComEA
MLKKILALVAMLYAAVAMAAVDVNKGTAAELDGVKGIGPGTSKLIMDERKKGEFKDWADFIKRVKGVGETRAAHLSEAGLTVNGQAYKKAADAKKDDKKDAKADKKDAKAEKKDEKKEAKAEKKEDKKETAAAKKDEKKEDKKASEAKPAASAKK